MKRWTMMITKPLLAVAIFAGSSVHAAALDARAQIAHAWQQYQQGVQTEQELIEVQISQGGQTLPGKLLWRRIRFGEQGQRVSVKFVEPVADLGLALLIERNISAPDQIWLRLPSWTNARKVVGSRETRYFADTAFTFEDNKQLIGEQTTLFDYRYLSQDANGAVINATPKTGTVSGYSHRDITLNAQGVPLQIDFFDDAPQALKTLRFEDISYPAPGRWRAGRIVLKQRDGSQTILKVHQRAFNSALAERVFTQSAMMENDSARGE